MAIENVATLNTRFKSVCVPSTIDAALGYLSDTACVPDAVYYQSEAAMGLYFDKAVIGLGGWVTAIVESRWWRAKAKEISTVGATIDDWRATGFFANDLRALDIYWLQDKLAEANMEHRWNLGTSWWTTLQLATRVARNRDEFCALIWYSTSHGHVLLTALGHPGDSRSDDLLIWNRNGNQMKPEFSWKKVFAPIQRLEPNDNEIAGLPRALFGDNKILTTWLVLFGLNPDSPKLVHKKHDDQYLPGRAPQSRL